MVVRYVVGKPETVDTSTFGRFLGHLAFDLPHELPAQEKGLAASYGPPTAFWWAAHVSPLRNGVAGI